MGTVIGLVAGIAIGALAAGLVAWRRLRHMRDVERRAREADRMATLGGLAGGLAHEIKNPLSTMSINLQLLDEDLRHLPEGGAGKLLMRVGTLRREVRRLEEVLEDFLRYARPHELKLEPLDVNRLLDEMLDFVTPEATQTGVRISRGFTPGLHPVRIDAARLKQAFLNIVINAKQAMPSGGELMVRTRAVSRPAGIEIDFIDTGSGISPDHLPRIWDVYFSTKERGTGLGLPTARRIIEEHGGSVRVHSEVGKGTSFTVFLPAGE